jgi:YbbR domain-containing protein
LWKLFSLAAAILLWFVVLGIEDPIQKRTITSDVDLINTEALETNSFMLKEPDKKYSVKLNVQARRSAMNNVSNNTEVITATVDLSRIDESYNNRLGDILPLPIDLDYQTSVYTVLSKEPESVTLSIDKYVTESRYITVMTWGTPAEGYEAMLPQYDDTVMISGSKELVDTIDYIVAEVPITNATDTVSEQNAALRVVDVDNTDITNQLTLSASEITVTVVVHPIKEGIPIKPTYVGDPTDGYYISDVEVSPTHVNLVGPVDELSRISEIVLSAVNVDDLTADKTINMSLWDYLPNNVGLKSGDVANVIVTVRVVIETVRHVQMPLTNIAVIRSALDDNPIISYSPIDGFVLIPLSGPEELINSVSLKDLTAELDATNLERGSQRVELHVNMPKGVSLLYPVELNVVVDADGNEAIVTPILTTH